MEIIIPEFQNQEEKNKIILITFLSIVPILPIIMYFLGQQLSGTSMRILKALVNFEILVIIASIIIYSVPLIGFLIGNLIPIANLVIVLMIIMAIYNNNEIKIPVLFKFIQ